jgi:PAS domain-containing protein
MRTFSVVLIGVRKDVLRMYRTLVRSEGAQASALHPIALVVLDGRMDDECPLPFYAKWRDMLREHTPDLVLLLEGALDLKLDLRRNLPPEIELCERLPGQILNASILNQQAFVRKTKTRQHFLESFIQALPVAAIIFDQAGHVMYWNSACSEFTGIAQAQVLGKIHVGLAFYAHERKLLGQLILESLNPEEVSKHYAGPDIEVESIPEGIRLLGHLTLRSDMDGYYQVIAQRIINGDQIIGSVQLVQDLTSWHVLQEQLKKQQEQLKAIISHLPFPLVHTNIQGRLLYANKAAQQSALHSRLRDKSFSAEDFNFFERFPEIEREFRPHFLSEISATPPELTPHQSKTLNVHIRDQEWAVTCLALPEQGKTWTLLWILHNISYKEEQDRLNAAVAMAGAISHELSQPLTAIINSAQLLGNTAVEDEERMKRHLRIITDQGERVLALYQKLHNISKFKLTNYLDMQIFDLERSADLDLTITNNKKQEKP